MASHYPVPKAALLPALHVAQEEVGWLPREAMEEVADLLGITPSDVLSVASFYTMFFKQPVGKHVIEVCTNISCSLMGADECLEHLQRRLGIGVGETTPDGRFTLKTVECLAACGNGPTLLMDEDYYEDLTLEKLESLLARAEEE
ncbi:MAG: NADH-quinone oxidoreductase subunit NuoE [Armatimonadetes bacterium]|nr:NADH-quinone oxidoreductase subunit NuoE [Armatimonadota bacterium]